MFAEDQSLNRNAEYLYTLLVPDRARTLFPSFDQPNLKAEFSLQLDIPARWTAVSNTAIINEKTTNDRKEIHFAPTEPLSTYLFSFVAGLLNRTEQFQNGQKIAVYHRETDPQKLMQLDKFSSGFCIYQVDGRIYGCTLSICKIRFDNTSRISIWGYGTYGCNSL